MENLLKSSNKNLYLLNRLVTNHFNDVFQFQPMRKSLPLAIFTFFLFSCVPMKDLTYLGGNLNESIETSKINRIPYKFQVGDNIAIDVKSDNASLVSVFLKNNALSEITSSGTRSITYKVDFKGNIRMPIFGEVNVLGFTADEVRLKLEKKFSQYFTQDDSYFVSVNLDGIKYTIMGEVNLPGPKVIYQNKLSIIDAITAAGDIPVTGDKKNVELFRITSQGIKKHTIDLTSIDALSSEIFYVQNNDYINIKPLSQKTLVEGLKSLQGIASIVSLITSTVLLLRGL